MTQAVLLVSHGSRSSKTIDEVAALVNDLKARTGIAIFEYAFLEVADPTIPKGLDSCVAKGADDVIILVNFLNAGRHLNEDIPQIIADAKKRHPNVRFRLSGPIGQHARIPELFVDLIKHA